MSPLVAAACALIAGAVEAGIAAFKQVVLNQLIFLSHDYVWMTPTSFLLLVVPATLVVDGSSKAVRRPLALSTVLGLLTAVLLFSMLIPYGAIAWWASARWQPASDCKSPARGQRPAGSGGSRRFDAWLLCWPRSWRRRGDGACWIERGPSDGRPRHFRLLPQAPPTYCSSCSIRFGLRTWGCTATTGRRRRSSRSWQRNPRSSTARSRQRRGHCRRMAACSPAARPAPWAPTG